MLGWFRTFIIRTSRNSCEERVGGSDAVPPPKRTGGETGLGELQDAGRGVGKGGFGGGDITFCRLEELSCVLSMIFTATCRERRDGAEPQQSPHAVGRTP